MRRAAPGKVSEQVEAAPGNLAGADKDDHQRPARENAMRTVTVKNYTRWSEPIAYGGTEQEPITPPVHAVLHKNRVISLRTAKTGYELAADDRIRIGNLDEADDGRWCEPNETHDDRQPFYVNPSGKSYCKTCRHKMRKQRRELIKQGINPREHRRQIVAEQREERVANMLARRATERQRSEREHFAVVARNLLFGVASGVEVNPDGSLTSTTEFPAIGQNTPMRGPLAQRRMFALAQFTAACTQHGYTVEQAAGFLGVEVEQVSWKQYRTAYPRKRQDDEQEEAA